MHAREKATSRESKLNPKPLSEMKDNLICENRNYRIRFIGHVRCKDNAQRKGGGDRGQKGKGILWKKHDERKKSTRENSGYIKAKDIKNK